jgi:hypothetical protein
MDRHPSDYQRPSQQVFLSVDRLHDAGNLYSLTRPDLIP